MLKVLIIVVVGVVVLVNAKIDVHETERKAEKLFKPTCERNADFDTYETVKAGYVSYKECTDKYSTRGLLKASKKRAQWRQAFKRICDHIPNKVKCLDTFKVIARPCFNDEEYKIYKASINTTNAYDHALCADRIDGVIDFSTENGYDCYMLNVNKIAGCIAKATVARIIESSEENTHDEDIVNNCFKLKDCNGSSSDEPEA